MSRMEAMYVLVWSNMYVLGFWMWIVGWDVWMSLSGLHSFIIRARCGALMGV